MSSVCDCSFSASAEHSGYFPSRIFSHEITVIFRIIPGDQTPNSKLGDSQDIFSVSRREQGHTAKHESLPPEPPGAGAGPGPYDLRSWWSHGGRPRRQRRDTGRFLRNAPPPGSSLVNRHLMCKRCISTHMLPCPRNNSLQT